MKRVKAFFKENEGLAAILFAIMGSNILFFNQKGWLMNPVYIAGAAIVLLRNTVCMGTAEEVFTGTCLAGKPCTWAFVFCHGGRWI